METLNASDAKRAFGEVLLKVQKAPIGINRNGKPVAVVISTLEFEQLQALKEEHLKAQLQKGMASLEKGQVIEGHAVINALRKQIADA